LKAVAESGKDGIAELTKQVSDMKETVNILISQIQMLHSELKKNTNE
jgi:hypothetical protein